VSLWDYALIAGFVLGVAMYMRLAQTVESKWPYLGQKVGLRIILEMCRQKNSDGYRLAVWLALIYATATPLLLQWVFLRAMKI